MNDKTLVLDGLITAQRELESALSLLPAHLQFEKGRLDSSLLILEELLETLENMSDQDYDEDQEPEEED